jgi:hypothetical protein
MDRPLRSQRSRHMSKRRDIRSRAGCAEDRAQVFLSGLIFRRRSSFSRHVLIFADFL